MATAAAPRQVYRAFSLVFRVPAIREQTENVRRLVYLCYTAAIAVRALDILISGNLSVKAILILMGAIITAGVTMFALANASMPNDKEIFRQREPIE